MKREIKEEKSEKKEEKEEKIIQEGHEWEKRENGEE